MNLEQTEQRVWDYIEDRLDLNESLQFEQKMDRDESIGSMYVQCLDIHKSMQEMHLPEVSPDFSMHVLKKIDRLDSSYFHIQWIFVSFSILILCSALVSTGGMEINNTDQQLFYTTIDFSNWLSSSTFSYLLVFAFLPFLFLMDRYFNTLWLKNNTI